MPNNARILVVEDDRFSLDILTRRLKDLGFQVNGAASGENARAYLQLESQPDIVLLDINLPDASGLDILTEIRATRTRQELPVIMVSALSGSEVVINGLERGANDYVTKPIELPILVARIEGCLALKRNFDALLEAERQRVMFESLGAACHHIAQPLTVAINSLELYRLELTESSDTRDGELDKTMKCIEKASEIIHRMQAVSKYRTVPYVAEARIIDLGIEVEDAESKSPAHVP